MANMPRDERIRTETERITGLFAGLEPSELAFVRPMLQNMAFMVVTLEDLQEEINASGAVDEYMNGSAQYGRKASAAIQAYNATAKLYLSALDKLIGRLPKDQRKSALAELMAGDGQ